MKIIEDISYSIDDIIDQIKTTYGFVYVETSDHSGYVLLDNKIRLNIEFNEDERKLDSVILNFSDTTIDLTDNTIQADIYQSSIESAVQIVNLIKLMLGESESNDEDN